MPFELLKHDGAWTLRLRGVVDIFEAAALRTASLEAVGGASAGVVADLADAEGVDTSTTQVLLALKRALAAAGRPLRIERTPAPIAEAWRTMGLDGELA